MRIKHRTHRKRIRGYTLRKVPDRDHKIIEYFIEAGKEKTAADHIALNVDSADHKQLRLLEEYCDRFTDSEILFDTIITVYKNDSEIFPKSLILLARKEAARAAGREADHSLSRDRSIRSAGDQDAHGMESEPELRDLAGERHRSRRSLAGRDREK